MKFKYYDQVKIIFGFYEGLEGNVIDYNSYDNTYYVRGYKYGPHVITEWSSWILENSLQKVEE